MIEAIAKLKADAKDGGSDEAVYAALEAAARNHREDMISPEETVRRIKPAALAKFHDRFFRPEGALFVVVGDVKAEDVIARLEKRFGKWRVHGTPPPFEIPAVPPRTAPVVAATVAQQDVPLQIPAIGNVETINAVSIKALVGGEVTGVFFKEGQDVKKGDLLFQIDPRPYVASLKQAEATLARDVAQAKNAAEQAKRYEILVQKDYVSRDQYDQLRANADALAAAVDADKANVENSRLQLAYCTIRSPINGRVGSVLINKGSVVKANDLVMLTINQMAPIYVTFSVPEQNLSDIKKFMARGSLKVGAVIPGDEQRPALGELTFINNAVDTATGTIQLKGTFANNDRRLWPGQFVNVVLTLSTQRNAVVMPSAALQAGQQGQYVFVVKPDLTVESRPVVIARTFTDLVVVDNGVLYAAAGIANYDGTHVYALDAISGKLKWHNDSSGSLSGAQEGVSLQGELSLRDGTLCFPGGTMCGTARYDLRTGECRSKVAGSQLTVFDAYYPQHGGSYTDLNRTLPEPPRAVGPVEVELGVERFCVTSNGMPGQ